MANINKVFKKNKISTNSINSTINNINQGFKNLLKKTKICKFKNEQFTMYAGLLTLLLIIILLLNKHAYSIISFNKFSNIKEPFTIDVPDMKRPFLNIYDDNGKKINVVFITHPFTREECIIQYEDAKKKGVLFLGMSSYCEFPGIVSNPHDILHNPEDDAWKKYNYYELTEGWCHCFRNPEKYITDQNIPQVLISESDFANYDNHQPKPEIEKKYDFMYVCLKDNDKCEDGWQAYNRNWQIAKKCLDIMCEKYHLKGLLVGRINCEIPKGCHQLMELTDFMDYSKYIKTYNQCKFIFVPNIADASPRVLTEAMCFNLPALVNYNILGGWKYINERSGELFVNEYDFEGVLDKFLTKLNNNKYDTRQNFIDNWGTPNAGPKLLDFVCKCIPEEKLNFKKSDVKYLKPGI
jgi:hypothetical protein